VKKYAAIYADPPWRYNDRTPRGGAERHYKTLTLAQLCDFRLPSGEHVSKLAAADCCLFLWATWPLMPPAVAVMGAWGFTYKTCAFAWVKTTRAGKPATGLGHYTRGNTEVCLLATRGRPKRVDAGVPQVILDETLDEETIFSERKRHSAKPPEARDRIVRLLGDVPRVELFARQRAAGWDAHGDQLDTFEQTTDSTAVVG
jgi:N6-adenosine-specific RNA methylase IME4